MCSNEQHAITIYYLLQLCASFKTPSFSIIPRSKHTQCAPFYLLQGNLNSSTPMFFPVSFLTIFRPQAKHKKRALVYISFVSFFSPNIQFLFFPITLMSNDCTNLRLYNDKVLMHKLIFNTPSVPFYLSILLLCISTQILSLDISQYA